MHELVFAHLQADAGLTDAQVELLRGATEVFEVLNTDHHPMGTLSAAMITVDRVASILDGQRSELTSRFASSKEWAFGGARTPARWMALHTNITQKHAGHLIKQARELRDCPVVAAAFADGRLSAEKVRVLLAVREPRVNAAFTEQEATLVAKVAAVTVAEAESGLASWKQETIERSGINDPDPPEPPPNTNRFRLNSILDGHAVPDGEFDAATSAAIQAALDAHIKAWHADGQLVGDTRTLAELQGDALAELVAHGLGHTAPARAAVQVLLDYDTLTQRANDTDLMPFRSEIAGHGPTNPDVLRRLCCNADISRIIMRGRSEILDVGRHHRLATPAIRRAVWARSGGVCEGCRQMRLTWCQIHHIRPWEDGGETSIENSLLVCSHCHRLIHEGKHRVERTEHGFRLRRPDGTVIHQRPPPPWTQAA